MSDTTGQTDQGAVSPPAADPAQTSSTPAETPAEPTTTESTPETSEDASTPQEGAQADSEDSTDDSSPAEVGTDESGSTEQTSAEPEVVNDANGQHVNMPDGSVVTTRSHTLPISNAEQEVYELTHSGDQERYHYAPGDKEYNANSDPRLPNSHIAQMVEREIVSFAERIKEDAEAVVSPIWNSFVKVYEGELKQAISTGGGSGKVEA
jgi:hypothetical protein